MDEEAKVKHSKRIFQKETYVKKQVKIAKAFGVTEKEPHRFAKHSALNCGNPKCIMCANPRKTFNELTIQEKKHFQDLEAIRDKHSNGLNTPEE
jgi:hypothetical protein